MSGDITPNDWQEIEALIDQVLDSPPERRAALIAELSGGNEARRAELERLVAECEQAYPLLDRPVAERFATLLEDHVTRVPDVLADRYRVVRELGRGGMAVVYLARDMKHERDVAVKIVRPEVAASLGRQRFLREIAIAAKLKHPHIVPLFDSGEDEGFLYYVMPYQEEQSLRQRLKRDGALPIDEATAILSDVCDALAYAHEHGVVHRDIKPDNILLSGRHALVTDFGVARALSAASEHETLTTAGGVVGTAAYMAPEQESAGSQIDHRVDIYAVGVMAYEMLSGERPFSGDTPPSQRSSRSSSAATDLTRLRQEVPPALALLVMKCLATQPAERYQRAEELLVALGSLGAASRGRSPARVRWRPWISNASIPLAAAAVASLVWAIWPTGRDAESVRSAPPVAVLFRHGGNVELEPLAMGLTDNLISALGHVPGVIVRSLGAVLPYLDSITPPVVLSRRLEVEWVVDGRVYRVGDSTVASAQLTDASGRLIASSKVTVRRGEDVRLLEDLVPKVAALLRERGGDHVRVESWRAGTRSEEAFASMNRAHKEAQDANLLAAARDTLGAWRGFRRADAALERASRADRRWVDPVIERARLAHNTAYVLFGAGFGIDSLPATLGRGIAHADAVLRLRPEHPRALEIHGMLFHAKALMAPPNDSTSLLLGAAERSLRLAIDADTMLVGALNVLASIQYSRGQYEEAQLLAERAYAADAFYARPEQALGNLFNYSFENQEDVAARRWCTAYGKSLPEDWFAGYCRLMLMVWDELQPANPDSAWDVARSATALAEKAIRSSVGAQLEILVAGVFARNGQLGSAHRVLDAVRARIDGDPAIARGPYGLQMLEMEAAVRSRLGQHDAARILLQEYRRRDPESSARLTRSRRFAQLPNEPVRDSKRRDP